MGALDDVRLVELSGGRSVALASVAAGIRKLW
jgi:hypothetical protein